MINSDITKVLISYTLIDTVIQNTNHEKIIQITTEESFIICIFLYLIYLSLSYRILYMTYINFIVVMYYIYNSNDYKLNYMRRNVMWACTTYMLSIIIKDRYGFVIQTKYIYLLYGFNILSIISRYTILRICFKLISFISGYIGAHSIPKGHIVITCYGIIDTLPISLKTKLSLFNISDIILKYFITYNMCKYNEKLLEKLYKHDGDISPKSLQILQEILHNHKQLNDEYKSSLIDTLIPSNYDILNRSPIKQFICILFYDVVNSTELKDTWTDLKELYAIIDNNIHKQCKQLDIIGDCYIIICNDADILLQNAVTLLKVSNQAGYSVRIGLHNGTIISGIISKLPKYSLYGDAMNYASRIQHSCLPNEICCSESFYNSLIQKPIAEIHYKTLKGYPGEQKIYLLKEING